MTLVLVIDTATPTVTAAVVRANGVTSVLAERLTRDPRAHAESLTPNVLGAMSDSNVAMSDLDAVVVGCGPGPFTGLRVGMATAAAFGHALGVPVFGVCSLDGIGGGTTGEVLVVTDARRRELYWARYQDGVRVGGPAVDAPGERDPRFEFTLRGRPSVAIDLNGTASYDAAGASSIATEIKVSNLVVDDPTGRLPKTPFGASLGLDASMQGQKLDLKKVLLSLDKTARADNQLLVSGSLDLGTNNPAASALSIRSEGLDLTSYYDLFAGKPAPAGGATEKPAPPVTATPGADPTKEPAPVTLPFKKFDGDVNIARLFLRRGNARRIAGGVAFRLGYPRLEVSHFLR